MEQMKHHTKPQYAATVTAWAILTHPCMKGIIPLKTLSFHTLPKKGWGVASDFCEGRSARPERFLRVPIPSGGRGEGSVRVRTRVTAHGLQRPWVLCVTNLLCFLYLARSPVASPP